MRNDDQRAPQMARELITGAFPPDHITYKATGGDIDMYAFAGGSTGPDASAAWRNGRFVHGRVDGRSFASVDRYLAALNDLVRWLADV